MGAKNTSIDYDDEREKLPVPGIDSKPETGVEEVKQPNHDWSEMLNAYGAIAKKEIDKQGYHAVLLRPDETCPGTNFDTKCVILHLNDTGYVKHITCG